MPQARVFLRPKRVCLLVCRLSSTLASSLGDAIRLPLSHLSARPLALPPSSLFRRLSDPLLLLSSHSRFCRVCLLQNAFPAESLSSSSSRSTPRVAAGFPRTPILAFPLYQEMPRARRPRPKETDRSPSSGSSSLTFDNRREKERKRRVGKMVVEGQRR